MVHVSHTLKNDNKFYMAFTMHSINQKFSYFIYHCDFFGLSRGVNFNSIYTDGTGSNIQGKIQEMQYREPSADGVYYHTCVALDSHFLSLTFCIGKSEHGKTDTEDLQNIYSVWHMVGT